MNTNKCVILNDVQKLENRVECLARIDDYWKLCKRISTGEFVASELIDLNFTESIGQSKWMLIIFPRGQYNQNGITNGHVSVYLRLLSCDNRDKTLMVKSSVFFKSPYFQVKDECSCTMNATLLYGDVLKRCIGPFELVRLKELESSQYHHLFLNGTLTIGCELVTIPFSPRRTNLSPFHSGNHTSVHSNYNRKNGLESQLENRDKKSKSHASVQLYNQNSNYRLTEKKPQDLRTWSEKLSKMPEVENESNIENMPPNNQSNTQLKAAKMTNETEDSDEKPPVKVGRLITYFENMSISRK